MPRTRIVVSQPDLPAYDVRVGKGLFDELPSYLTTRFPETKRILCLCEPSARVDADVLRSLLIPAGFRVDLIELPVGQEQEAILVTEVWRACTNLGVSASTVVVALGGTDLCRIAAFCAATLCSGIPFLPAPRGFEALCRVPVRTFASLRVEGGEQVVFVPCAPAYVLAATEDVEACAPDDISAGLLYALQTALSADDEAFFAFLADVDAACSADPDALTAIAVRSIVSAADHRGSSFDSDTYIGSAFVKGFSRSLCSDVASARAMALRLAFALGVLECATPFELSKDVGETLTRLGYPAIPLQGVEVDNVLNGLLVDGAPSVSCVLPVDIGETRTVDVSRANMATALSRLA